MVRELLELKGYNTILVVVDCLSKCIHMVPTVTMVDLEGIAQLFLEHIWKHHGLPEEILSNRGSAEREQAALNADTAHGGQTLQTLYSLD